MQLLKELLKQYGPTVAIMICCVSIPIYAGIQSYVPAQVSLQVPEAQPATTVNDLLPLLKQIVDAKPEPHTVRQNLQPIPDPIVEAINRMERNHQQLVKLISDRDARQSEQLTQFLQSSNVGGTGAKRQFLSNLDEMKSLVKQALNELNGNVDRSGNTKEQLEDIYQDANVPQLPDAMVKGLAANPGARAMIHPDHGQPVIAVTEWGVTNYGGGKQLNLLRHNGRVYGQTVIHGDQSVGQKTQPPEPEKKPAFNLNLGNN